MENVIVHENRWGWGRARYIIAEGGKAICQVSIDDKDLSVAWLTNVSVHISSRGYGYGNKLLELAIEHAQQMHAEYLYLFCDPDGWCFEWYQRRGFKFLYFDTDGQAILKMKL